MGILASRLPHRRPPRNAAHMAAIVSALFVALTALATCWPSKVGAARGEESHYVPPITSPTLNESPHITTEIRPMYMYNWLPSGFVTGGGYFSLVAVQLRAAITDDLAFIATKDGYADLNFDAVLPDESGWANIAAGIKYAVVNEAEEGRLLTLGVRYEAPIGDIETAGINLQGAGDGFFNVFASGSTFLADQTELQASVGVNLAVDPDVNTSNLHAHLHLNHEIVPRLFGVFETNLIATIDESERTDSSAVGSFEGFDVVNFGSTDAGTVVTTAFGARYAVTDSIALGAAYEIPVTDRKDIIEQRVTVDAVFRF